MTLAPKTATLQALKAIPADLKHNPPRKGQPGAPNMAHPLQLCTAKGAAHVIGPAKGGKMLDEKKLSRSFSFLAITPEGAPEEVARILVWGTAARSYASVWLKVPGDWRGGHAHAGGYGYHRGSAAVNRALKSAGVLLDYDIEGRGETAYPGAIAAALLALDEYRPVYMLQAY